MSVRSSSSRLEPALAEVAVVLKNKDGTWTHRRIQCTGDNFNVRAFFASDPDKAANKGSRGQPRRVVDQRFENVEAALEAAETQFPPADPARWQTTRDATEPYWTDHIETLQPRAARPGDLGTLLVAGAFLGVLAAQLLIALGIVSRFVSSEEMWAGQSWGWMALVMWGSLGAFPAWLAARAVKRAVWRRNVAKEISRR